MSTPVDLKLEAVVVPVTDVDHARGVLRSPGVEARRRLPVRQRLPRRAAHATGLGMLGAVRHEDDDGRAGSAQGLYLIVSDIEAAPPISRAWCQPERGLPSNVARRAVPSRHDRSGQWPRAGPRQLLVLRHLQRSGRQHWLLQEIRTRLPGRVEGETAYASVADVAAALRRAAAAHGEHEAPRRREVRRQLARLVCRVHGGGAGRHRAADLNAQRSSVTSPAGCEQQISAVPGAGGSSGSGR